MENPFVTQRRVMKNLLWRIWRENPNLSEEKILALFSLKTGISEKTARQYLKEIKTAIEIAEEERLKKKESQSKLGGK